MAKPNSKASKKHNSLIGKKINYGGQRMEIVTHYFDGRIELENKKGRIIKTHLKDL
jgi:hypothetical protein